MEPHSLEAKTRRWLGGVLLLACAMLPACESSTAPSDPSAAVFRVRACRDQFFRVRITDPGTIERAQQLAGRVDQPILTGELARGRGGFNAPWSWHLTPGTIQFADVTTEVCDGCPAQLENNPAYWISSVGAVLSVDIADRRSRPVTKGAVARSAWRTTAR